MSSDQPSVSPVGGPGSLPPLIVVAVVAVALALAIAKPWAGSPSGGSIAATDVPPIAESAPAIHPPAAARSLTAGPSSAGNACDAEAGWRLSMIETNNGDPIKTWYSIEPVRATGPSDPTIPTIRIYTESLQRLGYCAGLVAGLPIRGAGASAWRLAPSGAPVAIPLVVTSGRGFDESGLGVLFVPPTGFGGIAAREWFPGQYVFAVPIGSAPEARLWFAADVIAVDARSSPREVPSG